MMIKQTILAAATALTMTMATIVPSHAVSAFLVKCNGSYSPAHNAYVYTGTYSYAGSYYTATFRSWCPSSINI